MSCCASRLASVSLHLIFFYLHLFGGNEACRQTRHLRTFGTLETEYRYVNLNIKNKTKGSSATTVVLEATIYSTRYFLICFSSFVFKRDVFYSVDLVFLFSVFYQFPGTRVVNTGIIEMPLLENNLLNCNVRRHVLNIWGPTLANHKTCRQLWQNWTYGVVHAMRFNRWRLLKAQFP